MLNFTYSVPHTWKNRGKRTEDRDRSFKTWKVVFFILAANFILLVTHGQKDQFLSSHLKQSEN